MKKIIAALCLAVPLTTPAASLKDFHLDLGIAAHERQKTRVWIVDRFQNVLKTRVDTRNTDSTANPLGIIDFYFELKPFKLGWLHTSSIFKEELHYGYNVLYLKYEVF